MEAPVINVHICWTRGVSEEEASAVQSGVGDVLKYVTRHFSVQAAGETCDADSWAESCRLSPARDRGYGPQVDASCVLTRQIPDGLARSQVSCLTVVILDQDITAGNNNYLFGLEEPLGSFKVGAVLSVVRLRDSTMSEKLVRRLARHEFGHALGLIPEGRSVNVDKIGLHCTNVCTMRQGMCLSGFEELTRGEESAEVIFCPECADYLRSGLADLKVVFGGP